MKKSIPADTFSILSNRDKIFKKVLQIYEFFGFSGLWAWSARRREDLRHGRSALWPALQR